LKGGHRELREFKELREFRELRGGSGAEQEVLVSFKGEGGLRNLGSLRNLRSLRGAREEFSIERGTFEYILHTSFQKI
jgi:hypothetical protein